MTRGEYNTVEHQTDDVGYELGGCQALGTGYPDVDCKGCRKILYRRKIARTGKESRS